MGHISAISGRDDNDIDDDDYKKNEYQFLDFRLDTWFILITISGS